MEDLQVIVILHSSWIPYVLCKISCYGYTVLEDTQLVSNINAKITGPS
uniref:Uncharacterized protein n=1 Tax=Arundo donax TaxID=35708 RepID=A0A0A9FIU1_ARUDO